MKNLSGEKEKTISSVYWEQDFVSFRAQKSMRMTEYIITCLYVFTFQFIEGIKTQNGIFSQPLQNLRAKKFRKSNSKIIAFDLF